MHEKFSIYGHAREIVVDVGMEVLLQVKSHRKRLFATWDGSLPCDGYGFRLPVAPSFLSCPNPKRKGFNRRLRVNVMSASGPAILYVVSRTIRRRRAEVPVGA